MPEPDYIIEVSTTGLGFRIALRGRAGMTGEGTTVEGVTVTDLLTGAGEAIGLDAKARRDTARLRLRELPDGLAIESPLDDER